MSDIKTGDNVCIVFQGFQSWTHATVEVPWDDGTLVTDRGTVRRGASGMWWWGYPANEGRLVTSVERVDQ